MATKRKFGDLYRDKSSRAGEQVHYILLMQRHLGSQYWSAIVLGVAGPEHVTSYFKPSAFWYELVSE